MKGIWHPWDDWRSWTERNLIVDAAGDSQGKSLKFADVPWLIKPMENFFDPAKRYVDIVKAVGVAGTTAGVAMVAGHTAKRATNLIYSIRTDPSKMRELATRVFDMGVDRIPAVQCRYDKTGSGGKREYVRRFRWPRGVEIKLQEAKASNFVFSRAEVLINDELWQFPPGLYETAITRAEGDFAFSKIVNISSASEGEDQSSHVEFLKGDQDHYHFACTHCGGLFEPLIGLESEKRYNQHRVIQWDPKGSIHHRAGTVKMVCPHCDCEKGIFPDHPRHRRGLLEAADYVSQRSKDDPPAPDRYSCHISGWIAWWKRWGSMLTSYLEAKEAQRGGDPEPIKMYYIQNEARTWKGQSSADNAELFVSKDYSLIAHDRETRQPIPASRIRSHPTPPIWHAPFEWEFEADRYVLADYQRAGEFWVLVLQASAGVDAEGNPMARFPMSGGTRFMHAAIVQTYDQIDEIATYFDVDPGHVAIDCGTDTKKGNIYENIVARGWRGLDGANSTRKGDRGYPHRVEKLNPHTGKIEPEKFQAPYSVPVLKGDPYWDPEIEDHRRAELIHWDKNWVTNTFDQIRQGKTDRYFGLPDNLHEIDRTWPEKQKILAQLDSMVFVKGIWEKKSTNAQEHIWDCWSMGLVLMWMEEYFGVHRVVEDHTEESTNDFSK